MVPSAYEVPRYSTDGCGIRLGNVRVLVIQYCTPYIVVYLLELMISSTIVDDDLDYLAVDKPNSL